MKWPKPNGHTGEPYSLHTVYEGYPRGGMEPLYAWLTRTYGTGGWVALRVTAGRVEAIAAVNDGEPEPARYGEGSR